MPLRILLHSCPLLFAQFYSVSPSKSTSNCLINASIQHIFSIVLYMTYCTEIWHSEKRAIVTNIDIDGYIFHSTKLLCQNVGVGLYVKTSINSME